MDWEAVPGGLTPRRLYGGGILLLGIGNISFGAGQYVGGSQLPLLSLIQFVMGVTLVAIGALVVSDSERLSTPDLSDRALLVIGVVGSLVGVYMLLGGLVLLSG